jgi:phosphotransferase system enzyme I (PtsI)
VKQTESRIKEVRERTLQNLGQEKAAIFDAHLMFLSDPMFVGEMKSCIESEKQPAETCRLASG